MGTFHFNPEIPLKGVKYDDEAACIMSKEEAIKRFGELAKKGCIRVPRMPYGAPGDKIHVDVKGPVGAPGDKVDARRHMKEKEVSDGNKTC